MTTAPVAAAFSSEEVMMDGEDILLSITVPVEEDYPVQYFEND
jgi:hypothetical protein